MIKRSPKVVSKVIPGTGEYWVDGSLLYTQSNTSFSRTSKMQGWNLENFHLRKLRGELLPHTPFLQYEHEFEHGGIFWKYLPEGDTQYAYTEDWIPFDDNIYFTEANLNSIASSYDIYYLTQAAAAKIYEDGYDALTAVAELRSTIRTFTSLRRQLINLIKKGDGIADSWLSYRYGWRVLYYDLVDLSKALSSLDSSSKRFSERVGYSESFVDTEYSDTISNSVWTWRQKTVTALNVSIRGSVVADISPPKWIFSPVLTAWELITFSFIIDWFIKVGIWLSSLHFLYLQTSYTAAGGVLMNGTRDSEIEILANPGGVTSTWTSKATLKEYAVRVPHRLSVIPRLHVTLDVPKLIDLWALASGGSSPRR